MQEPVSMQVDLEKLFLDFEYYEQIVKYHKENGRFCFSQEIRLKIGDATIFYEDKGLLKPSFGLINLAPFAYNR